MAIQATDIVLRLSGGAANTVAASSLGGAKSSTVAPAGLFDTVDGNEAAAGDIEYRGVYVHNAHATLTLTGAVAWVSSETPEVSTSIAIGVGTSAVNGTEQTIANETTAPTGVTFTAAATLGAAVALGDIPPGQGRFVWIRRTVTAGAAAVASTSYTFRVEGGTAA